jgi:hypothetical protein
MPHGIPGGVTTGHDNAPDPLHSAAAARAATQPKEGAVHDRRARRAARLVLAIGLLTALTGCVV